MLVVIIVLPTTDTITDVNFGVIFATGTYEQPWKCCNSSLVILQNDEANCTVKWALRFGETDPNNKGMYSSLFKKSIGASIFGMRVPLGKTRHHAKFQIYRPINA